MKEGTTGEAEVIRLRQSIETQMRRKILEAIRLCPESCGVLRRLPTCGLRHQRNTRTHHAAFWVFEASISATWG